MGIRSFVAIYKGGIFIKIVINAGHTKFGKGTGAIGKLNESVETRKIAYELMKQLAETGHEVIPAVFDRSDNNLKAAVDTATQNNADLFLSIHLNGGAATDQRFTRGKVKSYRGQKGSSTAFRN